jgi:hypothetical protein
MPSMDTCYSERARENNKKGERKMNTFFFSFFFVTAGLASKILSP